jgi:hypothetical protein
MTCEPTQTPADIDIPALREKYRIERDRRLRPEGQRQYLVTQGEFADHYYNNEGEAKRRWFLGEPYGPGFYAFDKLIQEWRDKADLEGLVIET